MLLVVVAAFASSLSGDYLTLHYGSAGAWTDAVAAQGLVATLDGQAVELLYAGDVYQLNAFGYTAGGQAYEHHVGSSVGTDVIVVGETDLSAGATLSMAHTWHTGELEITRTERFDERDLALVVSFTVLNRSSAPVEDLRVLFGFDPDQDAAGWGDYSTANSVSDVDGDGVDEWASATGPSSGVAVGIGACDVWQSAEGFWSDWQGNVGVDPALTDPEGAPGDSAMGLEWFAPEPLEPGGTFAFRLVVAVDADEAGARDSYQDLAAEACCDNDGDGVAAAGCGGADCDDRRPDFGPDATDVPYDGVDQDCSGADLVDVDGDGDVAVAAGGRDCADDDATLGSAMAEVWYDGIDQDCDGNDDDQDRDGQPLAYDCDDLDPGIQTGCPEPDTDDGDPVVAGDCGCQGAPAAAWLGPLAALGLLRRRR